MPYFFLKPDSLDPNPVDITKLQVHHELQIHHVHHVLQVLQPVRQGEVLQYKARSGKHIK